jgi:hypothetical protein
MSDSQHALIPKPLVTTSLFRNLKFKLHTVLRVTLEQVMKARGGAEV